MKFAWNDVAMVEAVDRGVRARLDDLAFEFERIMQELFRMPKHGRRSRRGRKWHTASAPGEAPAIDTGRLRQSITHQFEKTADGQDFVVIGTTIGSPPYPRYLEFGTSRMKPRPAWLPALNALRIRQSSR